MIWSYRRKANECRREAIHVKGGWCSFRMLRFLCVEICSASRNRPTKAGRNARTNTTIYSGSFALGIVFYVKIVYTYYVLLLIIIIVVVLWFWQDKTTQHPGPKKATQLVSVYWKEQRRYSAVLAQCMSCALRKNILYVLRSAVASKGNTRSYSASHILRTANDTLCKT